MKVYLTGMPELRLGLNDKAMFEDHAKGARAPYSPLSHLATNSSIFCAQANPLPTLPSFADAIDVVA